LSRWALGSPVSLSLSDRIGCALLVLVATLLIALAMTLSGCASRKPPVLTTVKIQTSSPVPR
jgi:hypothetical protein